LTEIQKKMVYYAMPLIMKSENGPSTQHQQFCVNPNQVSESFNGQMSSSLQPQQAQLINISNGDLNGSHSQQNNFTYQLLTSNDHQSKAQTQSSVPVGNQKALKQTKSFKCEQCNMMFTTKSAHTSHLKSHAKQAAAQNPANTSIASGSQQLQSSDPYQCDVCKKTFAVPARLVS
jgi:hypothetical protein